MKDSLEETAEKLLNQIKEIHRQLNIEIDYYNQEYAENLRTKVYKVKLVEEEWQQSQQVSDIHNVHQQLESYQITIEGLKKIIESQQVSDEKVLINALNDIVNWNDDLDAEWGDPGGRASNALKKYKQSKPLTPNE